MKTKKQNGFVIELMIVFMLVTFGFCMVVTTFMSMLVTERKLTNKEFERQMTLNQIGEYYLRAVEAGKNFPTLNQDDNLNSYDWIKNDAVAKEFFNNCKGKYNFTTGFYAKRAGFSENYNIKTVSHKLTVKSGNTTQLIVIIDEKRNVLDENGKTRKDAANYCVKDWSISDIDNGITYSSAENISWFKKLWNWLGNTIEQWEDYFNG